MFLKTVRRKELQAKRLELSHSKNLSEWNEQISHHVAAYLRAQPASIWASYQPRSFEANPNLNLNQTPHRWAYPRVVGEDLQFFEPRTEADWESGYGGIKEPKALSFNQIEKNKLAGVLVPAVAFDTEGGRVGSGKGFYDRVLADFQGLKVGVSWEAMVETRPLPAEDHDVRMDVLITETCVRDMRKG